LENKEKRLQSLREQQHQKELDLCKQQVPITQKSQKILSQKEKLTFINRTKMFEMKKQEHIEQIKQETSTDFIPKTLNKKSKSKYLELQKWGVSDNRDKSEEPN